MTLGPLAFLSPWLLTGLVALPVIWWLLRAIPPRPQRISFPPTRILLDIENKEYTPSKTPWWLTLIRLLAAACLILALANPVLNPERGKTIAGGGPLVLVVDNGWASGTHWLARSKMLHLLISRADYNARAIMLVPTAVATSSTVVKLLTPTTARAAAAALRPQPFRPDRKAALAALKSALAAGTSASIVWLSDGLDYTQRTAAFAKGLQDLAGTDGGLTVISVGGGEEALGLASRLAAGGKLVADVKRADGVARNGLIHAFSARGQRLAEASFSFGAGSTLAHANFDIPLELRNQVTRLEIAGTRSAGAVTLLDARSHWHRVGLIAGASREQAQPLLSPLYYIRRALAPFAELLAAKDANVATALAAALKQNASVLVLADIGRLSGGPRKQVEQWVKKGGVLVRFSGPRLEKGGDDLLPVKLRLGGRALGGALSWATPQQLAAFDERSLFAGLTPPDEVLVSRQVLADPADLGPNIKIWARLKDGTPLVTAAKRGDGMIVLFHVTANSDWSNLPLSGLFVEMLRRITTLGRLGGPGAPAEAAVAGREHGSDGEVLAPLQTLDGFGILKPPPATVQAIALAKLDRTVPSAAHPPGYWGPAGRPRALNIIGPKTILRPISGLPAGTKHLAYESEHVISLKPWLLAAALVLVFADILAVLFIQMGGLRLRQGVPGSASSLTTVAIGCALAGLIWAATPALAQNNSTGTPATSGVRDKTKPGDGLAIRTTRKATIAYVISGDAAIDRISKLGLNGLSKVLTARTAVEPAQPVGVNIDRDELAFFPILYWPVLPDAKALSETGLARVDAYMKQGGLIIFDTRDYGESLPTANGLQGPGSAALQRLLGKLDIPPLEAVPDRHVLTKSFYLLSSFPGRWAGGTLWVEAQGDAGSLSGKRARRADGVSSVLITSNDFAAAWALDESNRPVLPVVPGKHRQREMAFRVGVNIVMYALTGNYKADQVHVPALLERLGQ